MTLTVVVRQVGSEKALSGSVVDVGYDGELVRFAARGERRERELVPKQQREQTLLTPRCLPFSSLW